MLFRSPRLAQGRADGTPWHGHHIAERYGLLAIIALGEGVVGTAASSQSALADVGGWDLDTVLLLITGIGLTFGMWWSYFQVPFGDLLHHRPGRGYVFGFGHIPVFVAIAAVGAGLHVAGLARLAEPTGAEDTATIPALTVVMCLALPVGLYTVAIAVLEALLLGRPQGLHLAGVLGALLLLAAAIALAPVSVAGALVVVMIASFAPVAGYEFGGHRHQSARLAALHRE